MAGTSPSEIKVPALTQIGIVVKDLDKTVKDYWNMLGIGPWQILTMESPGMYDQTYHGKSACFRYKAGLAKVGPVEIELMENIEGTTTYSDFMAKHGEGGHHLQYLVDSVETIDRHVEVMARKGISSAGGGRFGDNGGWNYLDTASALGTIWEPVKMADNFSGPTATYPAAQSAISPAKIKVKAITQISLAVRDLERSMDNYRTLLGINDWKVFDVKPPMLHGHTYHRRPGNFTMKVGLALGEQLELIQPTSGDSVYKDFLAEYGEGINHLQFTVDNVEEIIPIMEKEGFPLLQSGRAIGDDYFSYYDTIGPLKIMWEAWQPPQKPL